MITDDRRRELKEMVEEVLSNFIADDLFSWGYWDGHDDIEPEEFDLLEEIFVIEYKVKTHEDE